MTNNHTLNTTDPGLLERMMFFTVSTVPCCVFLFINVTMLYTLRSNSVFCETSRFILLYNLLFADTIHMALCQILYIVVFCRVELTYPVCCVLAMLAHLTQKVSPLTLMMMCLERYVAVCYPLRHAAIITIRNTGLAITGIWTFSSLSDLIHLVLLFNFPFEKLQSLHMKHFCSMNSLLFSPMSYLYDRAYTGLVFVSAAVAVGFSYIGVLIAARSASTDKASAHKARNTLLLHLVQLLLSLSSTIHQPLITAISKVLDRKTSVRIQIVLYVCNVIFPRCLSSLIYGIRDQTIRPVLIHNLCCQWRRSLSVSVVLGEAKLRIHINS